MNMAKAAATVGESHMTEEPEQEALFYIEGPDEGAGPRAG